MALDEVRMTFRTFPYKGTCVVGTVCLGLMLWWIIFHDVPWIISGLLAGLLLLCFFISAIGSLIIGLFERSKKSLIRILINVLIVVLFFPLIHLGLFLNEKLFLWKLPRFQQATDFLVEEEKGKLAGGRSDVFADRVYLPGGYSDLNVSDRLFMEIEPDHVVTVMYFTRDSSALGHLGYLYRSNDNLDSLKAERPNLGFRRLAPNWYLFVD